MDKNEPKKPNPIDVYVGGRIKLRRNQLGISQEKLGEALGVTFQQIQKYEKGSNRVGASRLNAISKVLGAPVEFFFEGAPDVNGSGKGAKAINIDKAALEQMEFATSTEGVKLIREFCRIQDPTLRSKFIGMIKAVADAGK